MYLTCANPVKHVEYATVCHTHRSRDDEWWGDSVGRVEPRRPLAGWPSGATGIAGRRSQSMYPAMHKVHSLHPEKEQSMHHTNVH